jgi:hypothetical protein
MTTKYIAKLNDKIVGWRTSKNRTYTHAIVRQRDEAKAREEAYNYVADEADRAHFALHIEIVDQGMNHRFTRPEKWRPDGNRARYEEACAVVEAGWDAYVAAQRQRQIDRFEHNVRQGAFKPYVGAWAERLDLAEKQARSNDWQGKVLAIVPAEEVRPALRVPAEEI